MMTMGSQFHSEIIDTCVFISALRSNRGASFKILSLIDSDKFEFYLSAALVLERDLSRYSNASNSNLARKACPRTLWCVAARKLDQLDSVLLLDELKIPPCNRLESLYGNRSGFNGKAIDVLVEFINQLTMQPQSPHGSFRLRPR